VFVGSCREIIEAMDEEQPGTPQGEDEGSIRVAVVDDHAMVAEGLSSLLAEEPDLEVVGTAPSVAEAMDLIEQSRPDVVLIDYRLPDGDGASAAAEILRRWPATRVILLSASGGEELLARALEAGCSGFLAKDRSGEEVAAAVRAAYRGESLIPTEALTGLLDRLRRPSGRPGGELSARELEVLRLLARGTSTEAISEQLFLSEHTVRNHVRNILSKLGAHSKLEAVSIAARDGIVSLDEPR
jgi:DNA-binding NarL/FixJ family response regulator